MTLDDRGHRAARNLKEKVGEAPLLLLERGVPGARQPGLQSRLLSFAGAFAAVVLLVGLTLVQVDLFAPQEETSTTSDTFPVNTLPPTTTTATAPTTTAGPAATTPPAATIPAPVDVDNIAPSLVITSPENGATVSEKSLRFEGTTEPGAVVAAGPYLAEVSDDGHWSIVLLLNAGGNLASFTSTDAAGNVAKASVSVVYEAPGPPKDEPAPVEFAASQKWGSCSESPPYDEFSGTAKPGTRVSIVSSFGSGSTTAGAGGEWYAKVFFETAPYGKTFEVKVKDEFGNKVLFEFTSYVEK